MRNSSGKPKPKEIKEPIKPKKEKTSTDGKGASKLAGVIPSQNKKSKIMPQLDKENISNISKDINSCSNSETNIIISDNLNQATKKSNVFKSNVNTEQKELENMKSSLVQLYYINALLEENYEKQKMQANVRII